MNDQSALIRLAVSLSTKPWSGVANDLGCKNPRYASRRIENAATMINTPSNTADRYSALLCP